MLFTVYAVDKPDSLQIRLDNRQAHLEWAAGFMDKIKIGGPMLADDGEAMAGSMFVMEYDSVEALRDLFKNDPYNKAGLFESVTIRPFKALLGAAAQA